MGIGRDGEGTEMKNPDDVHLGCAAITFWILRYAQNDSSFYSSTLFDDGNFGALADADFKFHTPVA